MHRHSLRLAFFGALLHLKLLDLALLRLHGHRYVRLEPIVPTPLQALLERSEEEREPSIFRKLRAFTEERFPGWRGWGLSSGFG